MRAIDGDVLRDRLQNLADDEGIAQGHEFDYQYCAYAERRTDEQT